MHNRELVHVVQCLQHLYRKSLGECHRESLKVIVLYKLVQVDTQHLKANEYMASEGEGVLDAHDVLGVLVILVAEGLQDLYLDLALLM